MKLTKTSETDRTIYNAKGKGWHNPHGPAYTHSRKEYSSYWVNNRQHNIVGPQRIGSDRTGYHIFAINGNYLD